MAERLFPASEASVRCSDGHRLTCVRTDRLERVEKCVARDFRFRTAFRAYDQVVNRNDSSETTLRIENRKPPNSALLHGLQGRMRVISWFAGSNVLRHDVANLNIRWPRGTRRHRDADIAVGQYLPTSLRSSLTTGTTPQSQSHMILAALARSVSGLQAFTSKFARSLTVMATYLSARCSRRV
jgi:hypothetical protein